MSDQIFLINGRELTELAAQEYVTEADLQELLARYPNLLPGAQIDPASPRKWLLVTREAPVPGEESACGAGYLDHLFLDQDGVPTLVEVKRSSDTRIRREVVGQMLDYAANSVAYWSVETVRGMLERRCEREGVDWQVALAEVLQEAGDVEGFWEAVGTNLAAGKIRLIFVADRLPREVVRIIEFLNSQMSPAEVLGVEIRQFGSMDLRTLVPDLVGRTSLAEGRKTVREYHKWDEESLYEDLRRRKGTQAEATVRRILSAIEPRVSRFWYGEGKASGSIVPIVDTREHSNPLLAVYTYGRIEVYFQHLKARTPFDAEERREQLRVKLNAIAGVDIPVEKLDKRPSIPVGLLAGDEAQNAFVETVFWLIDEIRRAQG